MMIVKKKRILKIRVKNKSKKKLREIKNLYLKTFASLDFAEFLSRVQALVIGEKSTLTLSEAECLVMMKFETLGAERNDEQISDSNKILRIILSLVCRDFSICFNGADTVLIFNRHFIKVDFLQHHASSWLMKKLPVKVSYCVGYQDRCPNGALKNSRRSSD